jgi:hypothetical protein
MLRPIRCTKNFNHVLIKICLYYIGYKYAITAQCKCKLVKIFNVHVITPE